MKLTKRPNLLAALIVLGLGLSVSLGGAWMVLRWERSTARQQVRSAADNRYAAVQREFDLIAAKLLSLSSLVEASNVITQSEFERFIRRLDMQSKELDSCYYLLAPDESLPGSSIRVRMVYCGDGPDFPGGWNPVRAPELRTVAEQALSSGEMTVSAPIRAPLDERNGPHLVMFRPVLQAESGSNRAEMPGARPVALVAVSFSAYRLVEGALRYLRPFGLDVALYDVTGSPGSLLYFHRSRRSRLSHAPKPFTPLTAGSGEHVDQRFTAGDRQWLVRCEPIADISFAIWNWQFVSVTVGGLLLTTLATLLFLEQGLRTAKIEQLVARRTRELAEARDQALEASRLKSQFLANVSHEIRTPLSGIVGMTEFLIDSPLQPEQRQWCETLRACSRALQTVINDILDMARIEAGRLAIDPHVFDPLEWIDECVQLVWPEAARKKLRLDVELDSLLPARLIGDAARLRQILINLLGNAAKFTERGGITVNVSWTGGDNGGLLLVKVRDTGIGIAADQQSRLFQRFVQVDGTSTRRFGGSGLGLAICKQLLELMQGNIGVESQLGEGSTFWFSLPCPVAPAEPDRPDTRHSGPLQGHTLLLCGGSRGSRTLLRAIAESAGAVCADASGIAEAVQLLEQQPCCIEPFRCAVLQLSNDELLPAEELDRFKQALAGKGTRLLVLCPAGALPDCLAAFPGMHALDVPVGRSRFVSTVAGMTAAVASAAVALETPSESPASQPTDLTPVPEASAERSKQSRGKVLLAEDNPVNRTIAVRMLEKLGYEVEAVSDGAEAIQSVRRFQHDLILMDCQMPRVDGFKATAEIRSLQDNRAAVPIIALTANAMAGDRDKCLEAGMDDYIAKPLELARLAEVLNRWRGPSEDCQRKESAEQSSHA